MCVTTFTNILSLFNPYWVASKFMRLCGQQSLAYTSLMQASTKKFRGADSSRSLELVIIWALFVVRAETCFLMTLIWWGVGFFAVPAFPYALLLTRIDCFTSFWKVLSLVVLIFVPLFGFNIPLRRFTSLMINCSLTLPPFGWTKRPFLYTKPYLSSVLFPRPYRAAIDLALYTPSITCSPSQFFAAESRIWPVRILFSYSLKGPSPTLSRPLWGSFSSSKCANSGEIICAYGWWHLRSVTRNFTAHRRAYGSKRP